MTIDIFLERKSDQSTRSFDFSPNVREHKLTPWADTGFWKGGRGVKMFKYKLTIFTIQCSRGRGAVEYF